MKNRTFCLSLVSTTKARVRQRQERETDDDRPAYICGMSVNQCAGSYCYVALTGTWCFQWFTWPGKQAKSVGRFDARARDARTRQLPFVDSDRDIGRKTVLSHSIVTGDWWPVGVLRLAVVPRHLQLRYSEFRVVEEVCEVRNTAPEAIKPSHTSFANCWHHKKEDSSRKG